MMQLGCTNGTILQYHQLNGAKLIILLHLAVQVAGLEVVEVVVGEEEGEPQAGHHHNQNYTWNLNNVPLFRKKKVCHLFPMLYAEHRFSHNKLCVWYFHLYDEMRALFVHVLKPKTKHLGDTLVGNTLFRFCYRRLYKKCDIQKTQYFSTPPRQNRAATIGRLKNGH